MGLQTEVPNEQGWYWAECPDDRWLMAFVDTGQETVSFWDGDEPRYAAAVFDWDATNVNGVLRWYGPFACPGGDLGEMTIVLDSEAHERASRERKAIVVVHVDYRYCRDEGHGSSITSLSFQTRKAAARYIEREAKGFAKEAEMYAGKEPTDAA